MNTFKERTATIKIYGEEKITNEQSGKKEEVPVVISFTFPEIYLEFRIADIESDRPNLCSLRLYGVSRNTYSMFANKNFAKYGTQQFVEIYVGYNRGEELAYRGTISRVRYQFDFGKQYMEILLDHNMKKYAVQRKSICIATQTTTYDAINVLCKEFGYKLLCNNIDDLKKIRLKNITFNGNLKQCLSQVLNKTMNYYIDNDNVVIYTSDKSLKKIYRLTFDNGLKTYPTLDTNKINEGEFYSIKHKIIPSIRNGDIIEIPIGDDGLFAKVDTGRYQKYVVQEYTTTFSPENDSTEMECVKING